MVVYPKCCKKRRCPVSNSELEKQRRNRAMDLRDIVLNYLTDKRAGNAATHHVVSERCDERRSGTTSWSTETREIEFKESPSDGYRSRSLKTRFGELNLQKPQLREIPFKMQVFERYSRTEKALVNAIIELYIQGVSTRNFENVISH
jgi:transposase-like protein